MTDYLDMRESFQLDVPERFNYTRDVVDDWARREPDKLALVAVAANGADVRRLSFAEVSQQASRTAGFLAAHGVAKGDRVFVMLGRVPEWYSIVLGCCRLGAVTMPGTTQLTGRDILYRLTASDATVVVTNEAGVERVDAIREECPELRLCVVVGDSGGPPDGWLSFADGLAGAGEDTPVEDTRADDPLLVYFTSGTTAHPKMVLHTQASLGIGHEITARFWQDLRPDDLHWTFSDMGWAKAAWGKLFGQWRLGAAVFCWDVQGKPDPAELLGLIEREGVTTFCAPPTVYRALVLQDLGSYDWSRLRHCVGAGEPLNPEIIKQWRDATGLTIYDGYGQTETVNLVATLPGMELRPGSMGKPTPGNDVAVVDDDGRVLGRGDEGHIAVRVRPQRPVGLFKEYWRDPELTAQVFRGDWYYTGDRAWVDEDGYFWFLSRDDDVIISSGYRIGPFEVESALIEHPAVAEAAVVGKPDADRGQIVKAYVVLVPGFEPGDELAADLQRHCQEITAPYKYPREITFEEELPKTISGKIRRVELRERDAKPAGE